MVVQLQYLIHRQVSPLNILEEHAASRHADGTALALVGRLFYVLLVVGRLEVDRNHVSTTRIAARHRHVGDIEGASMSGFLIVIQQYLYLYLPVQHVPFHLSSHRFSKDDSIASSSAVT